MPVTAYLARAGRTHACLPKFSGIYADLDTAHRELCTAIGIDPTGPLGMYIRGARAVGFTLGAVTGIDWATIRRVSVDPDQVVTVIEEEVSV